MNRSERHHLKENELATIAASARDAVQAKQTQIVTIVVGVVVVLAIAGGYYAWTRSVNGKAQRLLAEAMVLDDARIGPAAAPGTPEAGGKSFETERARQQEALTKYKIVTDEYPNTDAGLFARYRMAGTYMALGEAKSAIEHFQVVVDKEGDSLTGQMARLGLAEAQAQTGATDAAIATFSDLAQRKDGPIPVDGVLARLARVYLEAGKKADAEKTFNRLVTEFPDSPFVSDARRALDEIKRT
jgi:TolA-binding protein